MEQIAPHCPNTPAFLKSVQEYFLWVLLSKGCGILFTMNQKRTKCQKKTVPYGLGGPSRSRRSLKDMVPEMLAEPSSRCRCANQKDKKCLNFCQTGKDLWAQSTVEKTLRHRNKAGNCIGPKCMNRQLVDSKKMKRLEAIGNSIKASFSIAKLKAELQKGWKLKHNRANKRQSIWESLKAS
ncbi:endothelin-1 isoform 2-T2 [Theristicus caerulescens]